MMAIGGLATACGRPNPGFKLIDSSDAGDSDGQSASVGSTNSGPGTSTPTSTDTSGVTMTTASVGTMSSTVSTVSTGDPTGDTEGATTLPAGKWTFPTNCLEPFNTFFTPAAEDTFFANESVEVAATGCTWKPKVPLNDPIQCRDMQFSAAKEFQLYLLPVDDNPRNDDVGIYAVRFEMPVAPKYLDKVDIPPEAFTVVQARIRVAQAVEVLPWNVTLGVRRFVAGNTWTAGQAEKFSPCFAPSASFRCRVCPVNGSEKGACESEWRDVDLDVPDPAQDGIPYAVGAVDPELPPKMVVPQPPPVDGADLSFPFKPEQLGWLTSDGMMLMPVGKTEKGVVEVRTLETVHEDQRPGLVVSYCEPQPMD
ncbi:MAG: hypothetical protein H0T76_18070 [Nannocystis sp.]|nr:hypothetical protein [Nannocystis sp.]